MPRCRSSSSPGRRPHRRTRRSRQFVQRRLVTSSCSKTLDDAVDGVERVVVRIDLPDSSVESPSVSMASTPERRDRRARPRRCRTIASSSAVSSSAAASTPRMSASVCSMSSSLGSAPSSIVLRLGHHRLRSPRRRHRHRRLPRRQCRRPPSSSKSSPSSSALSSSNSSSNSSSHHGAGADVRHRRDVGRGAPTARW